MLVARYADDLGSVRRDIGPDDEAAAWREADAGDVNEAPMRSGSRPDHSGSIVIVVVLREAIATEGRQDRRDGSSIVCRPTSSVRRPSPSCHLACRWVSRLDLGVCRTL